jgi:hypothetical protein
MRHYEDALSIAAAWLDEASFYDLDLLDGHRDVNLMWGGLRQMCVWSFDSSIRGELVFLDGWADM